MKINFESLIKPLFSKKETEKKEPEAYQGKYPYSPYENSNPINFIPFDGEKTPFELGQPWDVYPDYYTTRLRAWEQYITTAEVQNVIKKYCLWVIGSGLKLQAEPVEFVLSKYANSTQLKDFTDKSEALFRLFTDINRSTYSCEQCIHELSAEALKNAIISGDILCISRHDGKATTLEAIDGKHVQTPINSNYIEEAERRGNRIIQGVEVNKKNSHIAYYVHLGNYKYKRVKAYSGRIRQAWLLYAQKSKIDDLRGMSLLIAIMESIAKLDRYKEATIGSAEENAKIPYTIEHNQFSDGTNPLTDQIAQSFGKNKGVAPETYTADCNAMATKIAQTTSKNVFNMTQGSKLSKPGTGNEINFAAFYTPNIEIVYTTIGIPPEVALDKFGGAYSGSRAALKSWEHKIKVDRVRLLKRGIYQPFYNYWLYIEILKNNINAPGYLEAIDQDNYMVIGAYQNCRFIGPLVPHIDPVKEVAAIRKQLGGMYDNVPLRSLEQSMEELNTGEVNSTFKKIENEKQFIQEFINNTSDSNSTTGQ